MTGWLGWTPDVALDTPLQQINLALEGKIDFLRKTNPWRTKEDVEREEMEERMADAASPGQVEEFFRGLAVIAKPLPSRKVTPPVTDG